jgi:hypothetical protein
VNFCTPSSVKPSKSLITLCTNVIALTCTAFYTFASIALPKIRNFVTILAKEHSTILSRESL